MKFDPVAICRILNEEQVDYVVVGGFASVVHGSPLPTEDVDVLPERSTENLTRLATALRRMNAMIRTEDEAIPVQLDAEFLANMPVMLNLTTDFGIVDLTFEPAGPANGYAEWNADASSEEIAEGLTVRVAALDNIIESKRAANRAKDLHALPYLESLREIRRSDS